MNTNAARSERDVWLELVAAVDYLSVTHRLGMTICDAIDEAVRTWTAAQRSEGMLLPIGATDVPWDDPDPLTVGNAPVSVPGYAPEPSAPGKGAVPAPIAGNEPVFSTPG